MFLLNNVYQLLTEEQREIVLGWATRKTRHWATNMAKFRTYVEQAWTALTEGCMTEAQFNTKMRRFFERHRNSF